MDAMKYDSESPSPQRVQEGFCSDAKRWRFPRIPAKPRSRLDVSGHDKERPDFAQRRQIVQCQCKIDLIFRDALDAAM